MINAFLVALNSEAPAVSEHWVATCFFPCTSARLYSQQWTNLTTTQWHTDAMISQQKGRSHHNPMAHRFETLPFLVANVYDMTYVVTNIDQTAKHKLFRRRLQHQEFFLVKGLTGIQQAFLANNHRLYISVFIPRP